MYFKTIAGKKAVKLMLASTLLKMGYSSTVGIPVTHEVISAGDLLQGSF
jgi:hypothetical protein